MIPRASLIIDIEGKALNDNDIRRLLSPLVGGVILFTRNFTDSKQLIELTQHIREVVNRPFLISVDHEGGRVQRFRSDGFTHLPAMAYWQQHNVDITVVRQMGWLMAVECLAHGIDLSYAPVLDLEQGSAVVGDRAFASNVEQAFPYIEAWCSGMHDAHMATVGKHFPGHGSTREDSHIASPVDHRTWQQIEQLDLAVFHQAFAKQCLNGVMPAHIIFEQIDSTPVGYSRIWLQEILRKQKHFDGIIFSDDLSMVGAGQHLSYLEKASLAINAGCQLLLVCNSPQGVDELLATLPVVDGMPSHEHLIRDLVVDHTWSLTALQNSSKYQTIKQMLKQLIGR